MDTGGRHFIPQFSCETVSSPESLAHRPSVHACNTSELTHSGQFLCPKQNLLSRGEGKIGEGQRERGGGRKGREGEGRGGEEERQGEERTEGEGERVR